jgi:hypothetical protein
MQVTGTNRIFSCERSTTATPESVWNVWVDVARWKLWDAGLADAIATEPLALGVRGTIVPHTGANAKFEVTRFEHARSYAFETTLIAAKLRVERTLVSARPTVFRHDVTFFGPLASVWAFLLGRGFRKALPSTMNAIAQLAEQESP